MRCGHAIDSVLLSRFEEVTSGPVLSMIWKYLVLFPLGSPRAEIKYSWGRSWAGTFFSEMGSTEDPQAFGGISHSGKVRRACLGHPRASAQLQLIVVSMESD